MFDAIASFPAIAYRLAGIRGVQISNSTTKSPGTRGVIEWPGLRFAWTQLPVTKRGKILSK